MNLTQLVLFSEPVPLLEGRFHSIYWIYSCDGWFGDSEGRHGIQYRNALRRSDGGGGGLEMGFIGLNRPRLA